jgi:hypothetical protein
MKAEEKGLPPPKMSGNRQAGQPASTKPTTGNSGLIGGNNSTFNAFKELKAVANGLKQYVGGPFLSSNNKNNKEVAARIIEYEGNQLEVHKDGSLKNTEELKSFRSNMALAFELEGEAPTNFKEARVEFRALKVSLLCFLF